MPVDPHPKFPGKSALEVIMTMLHSGGKFEGKSYATSGGLHCVGVSVVNALSADTVIEVARNKLLYRQRFSRGTPLGWLEELGPTPNRSVEHTSVLQSLIRFSYTVFRLEK